MSRTILVEDKNFLLFRPKIRQTLSKKKEKGRKENPGAAEKLPSPSFTYEL